MKMTREEANEILKEDWRLLLPLILPAEWLQKQGA